jgi:hypothetical protein
MFCSYLLPARPGSSHSQPSRRAWIRVRRLGSNQIELQKNALKALESLSREQNRTSRLSSRRFGSFAKGLPHRAGRIYVDNAPPIRLARTCQSKTLRGRVRRFSPAPTAQPPRKRSGLRDRASDDALERGGAHGGVRPPTGVTAKSGKSLRSWDRGGVRER